MSEYQNIDWICGFANAQGGKIYIGKDDSGNVQVNDKHYIEIVVTATECTGNLITGYMTSGVKLARHIFRL